MSDTVWIGQSGLWAHAQDRAARERPRWTQAWWRKVLEIYLERGGKVLEDENIRDDPESPESDHRSVEVG